MPTEGNKINLHANLEALSSPVRYGTSGEISGRWLHPSGKLGICKRRLVARKKEQVGTDDREFRVEGINVLEYQSSEGDNLKGSSWQRKTRKWEAVMWGISWLWARCRAHRQAPSGRGASTQIRCAGGKPQCSCLWGYFSEHRFHNPKRLNGKLMQKDIKSSRNFQPLSVLWVGLGWEEWKRTLFLVVLIWILPELFSNEGPQNYGRWKWCWLMPVCATSNSFLKMSSKKQLSSCLYTWCAMVHTLAREPSELGEKTSLGVARFW